MCAKSFDQFLAYSRCLINVWSPFHVQSTLLSFLKDPEKAKAHSLHSRGILSFA